ncbi:hypothetical protein IscW_ISCW021582, partial [Ixodes scapularis]
CFLVVLQVHAYIISSLRKEMPSVFGKDSKKKDLIKGLGALYAEIQREHQISPGDFPDLKEMQEKLAAHDFTKFHLLKPRLLETVDRMLAEDIAQLMAMIPHEQTEHKDETVVKGGAFDGMEQSPFGALSPVDGKISGASAKAEMVKSKLPNSVLGKVWKLSDLDKDGMLDADEFALAMHLINVKVAGHDLPTELPEHLLPPSKRGFAAPV